MTLETVRIEGCDVALRRRGTGTPLLLLHGIGGSDWPEEMLAALEARHELVIPDHPGFGASENPAWLRTMDDLAYFYLGFLETLGLGPVDVVGHSLGGWLAAEIAIRNPAAVGRLVLVAPAGLRRKGEPTGDVFIWNKDENIANLFHDPEIGRARFDRTFSREELEVQLKNRYTGARLSWEPRLFNPVLQRWVHRIAAPVTLVWGDDDKVIPPTYAETWAESLPAARTVTIPACGHLVHIEKPAALAEAVLSATGA